MVNKIFFYFFCCLLFSQEQSSQSFKLEPELVQILNQVQENNALLQTVLKDGDTVLNIFIYADADLELIKYLVSLGADVNLKDINGYTPLHLAVERDRKDLVEYLLGLGAKPNLKTNLSSSTPMHLAAESSSPEILAILLERDVECDVLDSHDNSPLHLAVSNNKLENVQKLLQACSEVNFVNNNRQTPLHLAVEVDQIDMVNDLLQAGADPNARDVLNKSPLDYVQLDAQNGASISAVLKAAGAVENQPETFLNFASLGQILDRDFLTNSQNHVSNEDLDLFVSEQASEYQLDPIMLSAYVKTFYEQKIAEGLPVTRHDIINWINAFMAARYLPSAAD
jgi:ankyrin repeat protein